MKILITGAAGFLGLHLTKKLQKNNTLILLDIAPYDPKEYKGNLTCIQDDIRNKKVVSEIMKDVDYVIHAAAALPLWKKEEIIDTNVRGTEILLHFALKNKIKRFVYISSTAVYGIPKKHPIFETDPLVGVGAYGTSKIEAEKLCEKYRKKGLIVTVLRPKTFVGTHRLGVFEILFNWIKDGKKIPILGNGQNLYQLLDVDDLVDAIEYTLTYPQKKRINDTFNIGSEKFSTVEKDLGQVFEYAQSGSQILKTPAGIIKKFLYVFEKIGLSPLYQWVYDTADKDSFVSIDKLKKIGFIPRFSNAHALIKAYKWYAAHYKEIKKQGSGVTHTVGWKQGILGFFKRFL